MFGFIITFLIFGCMSLKTHIHYGEKETTHLKAGINKRYKVGIDNFVYLIKMQSPVFCMGIPNCKPGVDSSASGLVFSSDDKSIFVLTAAHFCENSLIPGEPETIIGFANDIDRQLFVVEKNKDLDLCMLVGVKYKNEYFKNIKLASSPPDLGDDIHIVAAPNGVGGPGFRLVFDGKFGGCNTAGCMVTAPATFGSSGAGVYNEKGELITIVMAVTEDFENLILTPPKSGLRNFIQNLDSEVDIYPYED